MPCSSPTIIDAIRNADYECIEEHIRNFGVNQPLVTAEEADLNVLHIAAGVDSETRDAVLEFILNHDSVEVDAPSGRGNEGWTAAHITACWGYHRTLDILLRHSADPYITDVNGLNVWDIAQVYDNYSCIYVLESRMNRLNDNTILIDDDDEKKSIVSNESANEYVHVDKTFGVAFLEEKAAACEHFETISQGPVTIDDSLCALDDIKLRHLLIQSGESPGPVVASTREFYLRRLQRLRSASRDAGPLVENVSEEGPSPDTNVIASLLPSYSVEINQIINGQFNLVEGRRLEKELILFFSQDGSKSYFNYLLVDPRSILNNGRLSITTGSETTFDPKLFMSFVKGIFYIGKGHGRRPLMHLYEAAFQSRGRTTPKKKNNAKCERILDIWQDDYGVISLHCFQSISSQEALARECLMIEALSLQNLTNIQIGQNRTKLLRWTEGKRRLAGAFLLFKAYWIFCVEGHNQIRMTDVRF